MQQLDRAVRVVAGQREIGHADVEPVLALELDVAQIQLAVALLVEHGHFDRVHARRQDLLRDEAAVVGDGHLRGPPRRPCAGRDRAAAHGDGAARERNVAQPQLVLAVRDAQRSRRRVASRPSAGVRRGSRRPPGISSAYGAPAVVTSASKDSPLRSRRRLLGRRLLGHGADLAIGDPQRLRHGLVERAAAAVRAQHVLELARRRRERLGLRQPLARAVGPNTTTRERLGLERLLGREDAHLGALDEVRVVRIHA